MRFKTLVKTQQFHFFDKIQFFQKKDVYYSPD